jgi:cation transport ATPase
MTPAGSAPSEQHAHGGPAVPPAACPGCGRQVDPLRAGHVAILHERFVYFCGWGCREDYLAREPEGPPSPPSIAPLDARGLSEAEPVEPPAPRRAPHGATEAAEAGGGAEAPADDGEPDETAWEQEPVAPRSDTGTLLLLSATVAGVLAIALALTGTSGVVLAVRLAVGCLGAGLLAARVLLVRRDPADAHPAVTLAPLVVAAALAVWAKLAHDSLADEAAVLAGLVVVAMGTTTQLVEHVRREAVGSIRSIRDLLEAPARKVTPTGYAVVPSASLRPGEELVVDAGEIVPADVVVSAGEATVLPWLEARTAMRKGPGDALAAGARLVAGRLRATVSWTGLDLAWLRTSVDPVRAAHVAAPIARAARRVVEQGALGAAALAGLAAFVNNVRVPGVLLAVVAAHVAVASTATAAFPAFHVMHGVLEALRRGIAYRSPQAWERAAQVTALVFCARGTLLLGEPQVAEIVGLRDAPAERLLALAAGAEAAASGPIAAAVQRAAGARGIGADAVRSPVVVAGLGVTAVASSGEPLCVGSRALMLREHVSIAAVEGKLAEFEAHGRTVLLVALGGRLLGLVALQDGLRPGARASVQYLLDAGVEPVLLSGDARETCDAIARSLDIEHVRPEVPPAERAAEIRRIEESGAEVAVVGRPAQDLGALEAADVSIALEAAGSTMGEWSVTLGGDDVRDAARAVVLARRTRNHARTSLVVGLVPGVAAALSIAFGLLPAAYAPLAVLVGAIAAHLHARSVTSGAGAAAA